MTLQKKGSDKCFFCGHKRYFYLQGHGNDLFLCHDCFDWVKIMMESE